MKHLTIEENVIDLKERFGHKYKVAYDEAAGARHDPWMVQIPCQHGHFYPHGGREIGFATDKRGPIAKRLARLPFTKVVQDGDDGINLIFDIEHFDAIAAIVIPRKRRQVSESERQRLKEIGRQTRFSNGSKNDCGDLESPQRVSGI